MKIIRLTSGWMNGNIRQFIEKGKVYLENEDAYSAYVFEIYSTNDSSLKVYIK